MWDVRNARLAAQCVTRLPRPSTHGVEDDVAAIVDHYEQFDAAPPTGLKHGLDVRVERIHMFPESRVFVFKRRLLLKRFPHMAVCPHIGELSRPSFGTV